MRPERDAVQEVTHHVFQLGPPPQVDDPADDQVLQSAVAVEQGLESREQHHVERGLFGPAELVERRRQVRRQDEGLHSAAMAELRGSCMETFILPADLTTALNELGRAEQATLYM